MFFAYLKKYIVGTNLYFTVVQSFVTENGLCICVWFVWACVCVVCKYVYIIMCKYDGREYIKYAHNARFRNRQHTNKRSSDYCKRLVYLQFSPVRQAPAVPTSGPMTAYRSASTL